MTPRRSSLLVCAALLALYAATSWSAVATKSPTFDEPLHALAASIAWQTRDFRIDFDNPPLWKYWAALPNAGALAHVDPSDPHWRALPFDPLQQWPFAMQTLYRNPHNDPDRLIGRARVMMLALAVALGALTARWAFELGGAVAAIAAAFLFALDPSFLAHGPLVKNDVAVALLLLALAYTAWRADRMRVGSWALAVGLLCGAACTVKLSGILLPGVALLLVVATRTRPLLTVAGGLFGAALVTVGCIWAVYGFRFGVSPDPGVAVDTRLILTAVGEPPLGVRAVAWSLEHRWLPEPWLAGFLFAHGGTAQRPAYLLGEFRAIPWSGYLPLVVAFKTPLATLVAIAAAAVAAGASRRRDRRALACLAIPPLAYALLALSTPAASGVRHLLPIYPFLFIGCGLAAARAWQSARGRWLIAALAAVLALETIAAFPDYLAFHNVAAGGERAAVRRLGDSNLDWGQDLPLLAAWQREHPETPLSLAYFGTADPAHYGIRYANLPGGYALGPPPQLPSRPGVVAISATNLQGVRTAAGIADLYAPFRNLEPIAVLGGSIYLYTAP
jgi:dolichyl-phosphate-mannose-protein mannosyltransferase